MFEHVIEGCRCEGKRCNKCEIILCVGKFYRDRNRLRRDCKECRSKIAKVYRDRPDVQGRKRAYDKAYHETYYRQPEKLEHKLVYNCAYRSRLDIKERHNIYQKDWRRAHPDRQKAIKSRYHQSHVEKERTDRKMYNSRPEVRNRHRIWNRNRYNSHPEVQKQSLTYSRNRKSRKKSIAGTHTIEQIAEQLKRQRYRCYYAACGFAKFPKVNGKYVYHIDHTFPLSRVSGTSIPANDISYLVLACPSCNLSKKDKFPWEWPEGGRLL